MVNTQKEMIPPVIVFTFYSPLMLKVGSLAPKMSIFAMTLPMLYAASYPALPALLKLGLYIILGSD